jgi:hypothetical protein
LDLARCSAPDFETDFCSMIAVYDFTELFEIMHVFTGRCLKVVHFLPVDCLCESLKHTSNQYFLTCLVCCVITHHYV